MEAETRVCPECCEDWPLDRFTDRSNLCFRCRIQGISFTYGVGGAEGKAFFHNETTKSAQDRTIREAAANGYEAVPAWTTTSYGFATKQSESKVADAISPSKVQAVTE